MATPDYQPDSKAKRCCCGRIKDWTEDVIINGRLHERLGGEGSFCGPVDAHTTRDQQRELIRLRLLLAGAARGVDHVMDQIRREFGSVIDASPTPTAEGSENA